MNGTPAALKALVSGAQWMGRLLFRPFELCTWLWLGLLTLVTALSVYGGGISIQPFGLPTGDDAEEADGGFIQDFQWFQLAQQREELLGLLGLGVVVLLAGLLALVVVLTVAGGFAHCCFIDRLVWGRRSLGFLLRRYLGTAISLAVPMLAGLLVFLLMAVAIILAAFAALGLKPGELQSFSAETIDAEAIIGLLLALGLLVVACVLPLLLFLFGMANFVLPCAAVQHKGVLHAVGFAFRLAVSRFGACLLYLVARAGLAICAGMLSCILILPIAVLTALVEVLVPQALPEGDLLARVWVVVALLPLWLLCMYAMQLIYLPIAVYLRAMNLSFLSYVSPAFTGINPVDREQEPARRDVAEQGPVAPARDEVPPQAGEEPQDAAIQAPLPPPPPEDRRTAPVPPEWAVSLPALFPPEEEESPPAQPPLKECTKDTNSTESTFSSDDPFREDRHDSPPPDQDGVEDGPRNE